MYCRQVPFAIFLVHQTIICMLLISYRFAYESMKLFLCNLVKDFRVELREDTELNYKKGSTLLVAFSPLYLDLVLREEVE